MAEAKGAKEALWRLAAGEHLTREETEDLFGQLMDGLVSDPIKAALLVALRMKGESVPEIAGAAAAMRRHSVHIRHSLEGVVDTCGTGGDGRGPGRRRRRGLGGEARQPVGVEPLGERRRAGGAGGED